MLLGTEGDMMTSPALRKSAHAEVGSTRLTSTPFCFGPMPSDSRRYGLSRRCHSMPSLGKPVYFPFFS